MVYGVIRAIIRRLQRAGFAVVEGASHTKLIHADGRRTVRARHNDLPSGTVRAIERQTGV